MKEDKNFVNMFYKTKYPRDTHKLELDSCFDYYNGLCHQFLKNKKNLPHPIIPIEDKIKNKIENYISINKENEYGKEIINYYNMLQQAIIILYKHYKDD